MKVLIVGGTKYAGVHLVNKLISNDHDVTIATRGKTSDNFGDSVKRKIIERQDPNNLNDAFKDEYYDVVVDNLAYSSNDVKFILDSVNTKKYVMTSTISVYYNDFHMNMQEIEMDTKSIDLKWCTRDEYTYDEVKRQSEAALFQEYKNVPSVAVRFPWIFGTDDYTKRLFFYVEHIIDGRAMHIDNLDSRLTFINSMEAGNFLAWCVEKPILGYVNASSNGTVSLAEIINYVEKRTGKKALIHENGEAAPLNSVSDLSMDTTIAKSTGYNFKNISEWVYPTIDYWIDNLHKA